MNNNINDLINTDLRHIWHPAAQMKDYETFKPILVKRAKGVYLYTYDDKKIIDIISSWWCNLLGHNNDKINNALITQLKDFEHVIFANFTHKSAIDLVLNLQKILPKNLKRFNFADNGSSSVEMALKMAFQYCMQTGKTKKVKFACLEDGYHGETIGALSVGSLDKYTQIYRPMMLDSIHIKAPDCYRCPFNKNRDCCNAECLSYAKETFELHHEEICALILEPLLQGASGMKIYPIKYLQGIRDLCTQYDILLIADEIATGFGRTGDYFACTKANIEPDLMTISKGLTAGYMPMSIVCTTDKVYDAFYDDYAKGKAFLHSHTYAGNALSCAIANCVIDILINDGVLSKAKESSSYLTKRFNEEFLEHKNVGEIRHIGLIHAIELVSNKESKTSFDASQRIGYRIYQNALSKGLLLRPIGDVLYFNPALNIEKYDLDNAIDIAKHAIFEVLDNL